MHFLIQVYARHLGAETHTLTKLNDPLSRAVVVQMYMDMMGLIATGPLTCWR